MALSSLSTLSESCLICAEKDPSPEWKKKWNLLLKNSKESLSWDKKDEINSELCVFFIVRRLLGISSEFCEYLIYSKGNPSKWELSVCPTCQRIIKEAQFVYQRIQNLSRELEELSNKLKTSLLESIQNGEKEAEKESSEKISFSKKGRGRKQKKKIIEADKMISSASEEIRQQLLLQSKLRSKKDVSSVNLELDLDFDKNLEESIVNIPFDEDDSSGDDLMETEEDPLGGIGDQGDFLLEMEDDKASPSPGPSSSAHTKKESEERKTDPPETKDDFVFKNGKFCCPKCRKRFKSKYLTKAHVKRYHLGEPNPYDCKICGAKFRRIPRLQNHIRNKHDGLYEEDFPISIKEQDQDNTLLEEQEDYNDLDGFEDSIIEPDISAKEDSSENEIKKRPMRASKLKTASKLAASIAQEIKIERDSDYEDVDGEDVNAMVMKGDKDDPEFVLSPSKARQEEEDDEDELPETGDNDDDEDYDEKSKRRRNQRSRGPTNKRLNSGTVFQRKPKRLHIKNKYPCTECKMSFKEQYSLDAHILRRHYGDPNPFPCDLCDSRFRRMARLLVHKSKSHPEAPITSFHPDNPEADASGDEMDEREGEELRETAEEYKSLNVFSLDNHAASIDREGRSPEELELLEDIRIRGEGEPLVCDKCTKFKRKYKSTLMLQGHINWKHFGMEIPNICPISKCGKAFKKYAELYEHCLRHINGATFLKCSYPNCKKTFKTEFRLKAHEQQKHLGIRKAYKCSICHKGFTLQASLKDHINHIHNVHPDDAQSNETGESISKLYINLKPRVLNVRLPLVFKCSKCQQRFPSRLGVEAHLRKVHYGMKSSFHCTKCTQKFITDIDLRSHMTNDHKTEGEKKIQKGPFTCEFCEKVYKVRSYLQQHIQIQHKNERPFMCEYCPKTYTQGNYLKDHQRTEHHKELGVDPVKCPYPDCGRVLTNERILAQHIALLHTKEYKFPCTYCPQGFHYNTHLKDHLRLHTGEKPYKCPHCPKAFPRKLYLTNHVRHHTGDKPWKCQVKECGKEYSDHPTFKRHMETHGETVHKCGQCGKEFKVWHSYRLHMKSHGIVIKWSDVMEGQGVNAKRKDLNDHPIMTQQNEPIRSGPLENLKRIEHMESSFEEIDNQLQLASGSGVGNDPVGNVDKDDGTNVDSTMNENEFKDILQL